MVLIILVHGAGGIGMGGGTFGLGPSGGRELADQLVELLKPRAIEVVEADGHCPRDPCRVQMERNWCKALMAILI